MTLRFDDFVVAESVYAPGLRQGRHADDHSNVTIVTKGLIEETTPRGEYRALPSSIVLKAAGCEHDDRIGGFGAKTLAMQGAFADGRRSEVERSAVALIEELTAAPAGESELAWLSSLRKILDERFAGSGHLCRTFVSLIGVTPRAYRRIAT